MEDWQHSRKKVEKWVKFLAPYAQFFYHCNHNTPEFQRWMFNTRTKNKVKLKRLSAKFEAAFDNDKQKIRFQICLGDVIDGQGRGLAFDEDSLLRAFLQDKGNNNLFTLIKENKRDLRRLGDSFNQRYPNIKHQTQMAVVGAALTALFDDPANLYGDEPEAVFALEDIEPVQPMVITELMVRGKTEQGVGRLLQRPYLRISAR